MLIEQYALLLASHYSSISQKLINNVRLCLSCNVVNNFHFFAALYHSFHVCTFSQYAAVKLAKYTKYIQFLSQNMLLNDVWNHSRHKSQKINHSNVS